MYNRWIIEKDYLQKILTKFSPNYSVRQLSNLWIISPLKRWKYYFNNMGRDFIDPFTIWALYMEWKQYCYWWLWVYNRYWFTNQLADRYTIYNTTKSGKKIIWRQRVIFKRQRESFFYGMIEETSWSITYKIMSPERAFIERLKEWVVFKTLPRSVNQKKLIIMAQKYASKNIQVKIANICS